MIGPDTPEARQKQDQHVHEEINTQKVTYINKKRAREREDNHSGHRAERH